MYKTNLKEQLVAKKTATTIQRVTNKPKSEQEGGDCLVRDLFDVIGENLGQIAEAPGNER